MRRGYLIVVGTLTTLVGVGLVMPAIALLQETGALPAFSVGLLMLGLALTLGGGGAVVYGTRGLRA